VPKDSEPTSTEQRFVHSSPVHGSVVSRAGVVALLLVSLCALPGCAGNGPAPDDSGSSFDEIQSTIFNVSCISGPCHSSTAQQGNLVLEEGISYGRLVDVVPFNDTARAAGLLRVVPGNAAQSFLLIKLTGPGAGEGSPMPLAMPPLSAANIEKIRSWILAGAPGPGGPSPTPSPTLPPSATPTLTPSATDTVAPTVTLTPTVTPSGTQQSTATATVTATRTPTFTPTASPSGVPTPTFSIDSTLPQIQTTIFDTTCLDVGCHNATDRAGDQSLAPGESYGQLVNVTPSNVAAAQDGLLRVTPDDPDTSFLVTKLTLPTVFDLRYFSRMPLGKPMLSAEQIEHIRAWILRGALPDEAP
jgi:hypothetical protein